MELELQLECITPVTPYAGVWIEICSQQAMRQVRLVTPYAGVWIEMFITNQDYAAYNSHSLRGSVD